jgi:hypothetical protein
VHVARSQDGSGDGQLPVGPSSDGNPGIWSPSRDSMSALAICRQLRGPDHTFQIADHLSGTTVKKHMFRFSR